VCPFDSAHVSGHVLEKKRNRFDDRVIL
jgi:hypothetical protein